MGTPAQEPLNLNRTPSGAFADARVEEYAQRRASGSPPSEAALHGGFGKHLTSRLEGTQELSERIQQVQSESAEQLSLVWIVKQLMRNVYAGRAERSVKSSTDALVQLYEILQKHKEELGRVGAAVEKAAAEERRGTLRGRLSVIGGDNGKCQSPDPADGEAVGE